MDPSMNYMYAYWAVHGLIESILGSIVVLMFVRQLFRLTVSRSQLGLVEAGRGSTRTATNTLVTTNKTPKASSTFPIHDGYSKLSESETIYAKMSDSLSRSRKVTTGLFPPFFPRCFERRVMRFVGLSLGEKSSCGLVLGQGVARNI